MSKSELRRLYSSAELIVNLHGGTQPRPEHYETGRLVYLETDPVQLQIELHDEHQDTLDFLEPHVAFFTFGENYGRPGCGLPVSDRFTFHPTRQPVVTDFWLGAGSDSGLYTTVGNWRQTWRDVKFDGELYGWSKDEEFRKFLALPSLTGRDFELALSSYTPQDRELLESRGWRVRHCPRLLNRPRCLPRLHPRARAPNSPSRRTRTCDCARAGSATARRRTWLRAVPVVTQDTGFGAVLPTGEAIFPFITIDDAIAAIESDRGRLREGASGGLRARAGALRLRRSSGRRPRCGRSDLARQTREDACRSGDDRSRACLPTADRLAEPNSRGSAVTTRYRKPAAIVSDAVGTTSRSSSPRPMASSSRGCASRASC